jgi:hypothetical protein
MLALRVEELEKGDKSRVAIVGQTKKKRKASAVKKSKKKYRLLDAAKAAEAGIAECGNDNGEVMDELEEEVEEELRDGGRDEVESEERGGQDGKL